MLTLTWQFLRGAINNTNILKSSIALSTRPAFEMYQLLHLENFQKKIFSASSTLILFDMESPKHFQLLSGMYTCLVKTLWRYEWCYQLQKIYVKKYWLFFSHCFLLSAFPLTILILHWALPKTFRKSPSNQFHQEEEENAFPIIFKFSVELYTPDEVDYTQYAIWSRWDAGTL